MSRWVQASVVALISAFGRPTYASDRPARSSASDRVKPSAGVGADLDRPLDDLRRAHQNLEIAVRRRVPDWSPEAGLSKARVDAILAGLLDYETIARRALAAEWDNLTGAQRREFLEKFAVLTNQAFVAAVTRPDVRLTFDSETVIGEDASVFVTAREVERMHKNEEHVEYRMARRHDRWLVCDVLVDGASLVDGYRDQFTDLMRRGGFSEIIELMQHKLQVSSRY